MATILLPALASRVTIVDVRKFGKRDKPVTVKMSDEHYARMREAAEKHWPGAVLTDSSMILGLAMIAVEQILKKR
jgi:hypothetical protein